MSALIKAISFAIKCVNQQRFLDEQENEMGDYPRNPPFSKDEYINTIKQLRTVKELEAEIERLQFTIDSLCTCEDMPEDEGYLLTDKKCPIHGKDE